VLQVLAQLYWVLVQVFHCIRELRAQDRWWLSRQGQDLGWMDLLMVEELELLLSGLELVPVQHGYQQMCLYIHQQ
jgi:hypothetical protein